MTRCPCSTSTDALLTIAGLQPIDYTIRQICAFRYSLSIPHHIFSPLSKNIVQSIFRNSLFPLPSATSTLRVSAQWLSPSSVIILPKQTPYLPVLPNHLKPSEFSPTKIKNQRQNRIWRCHF
jgi:hypothetical protein